MTIGKGFLLVSMVALCATAQAAQERSIHVSNSLRVGYDDNVHHSSTKTSSMYLTDILQISAKATFSARTDLLVYYQPQFTWREDADANNVMYHLFYAKLSHAISERVFLNISDRFRYKGDDELSDSFSSNIDDIAYWENDAQASLDFVLNSLSSVNVAGGYYIKRFDDDDYAAWQDYDRAYGSAAYKRMFRQNTTYGYLSAGYNDVDYESSARGGYESITAYGGIGHHFTRNVSGSANVGFSRANVEGTVNGDNKTSAPYFSGGLTYKPSASTELSGSLNHSLTTSDNSVFNIQEATALRLGLKHDITAKIAGVASVGYTFSDYDAKNAVVGVDDAEEDYVQFSARLSYKISRMNYLDAGYEYSMRNSDQFENWKRNRYDIGWRIEL